MVNHGFNPYQAPATPAEHDGAEGCRRAGRRVWLQAGSDLPCRCVRCGSDEVLVEKTVKLQWYPPAVALLLLTAFFIGIFSVVAFALLALVLRRRTKLTLSWCAQHARSRRRQIWWSWIGLVLVFFFFAGGLYFEAGGWLAAAGAVFLLVLLPLSAYQSRCNVRAVRINRDYSVLQGFGQGFLDTLPRR